MEKSTTYNLSISEIKSHIPAAQWVGIGDDFCMFNIKSVKQLRGMSYPCRFEGFMILYCVKGRMKLSVNLNEYELEDNHLVLVSPEKILKVTDVPDQEDGTVNYVFVAMSRAFTENMRLDFKRLLNEGIALHETLDIVLSESHRFIMHDYLELMENLMLENLMYKKDTLSLVMSSMINFVAGLWTEKLDELKEESMKASSRSQMVFEQFIRLVGDYHTQYRNVGFYADKLCLTPKYLSKLIKNATGKSAPEWIDGFVILEAKNLLKYSGVSIKEIVYRLNFPNQSVFYKFFKCRTGMTPTEYRNS